MRNELHLERRSCATPPDRCVMATRHWRGQIDTHGEYTEKCVVAVHHKQTNVYFKP
ncbi:hypothetical protein EVAR_84456_1, partial [Eumeta japonica]